MLHLVAIILMIFLIIDWPISCTYWLIPDFYPPPPPISRFVPLENGRHWQTQRTETCPSVRSSFMYTVDGVWQYWCTELVSWLGLSHKIWSRKPCISTSTRATFYTWDSHITSVRHAVSCSAVFSNSTIGFIIMYVGMFIFAKKTLR